jgi:hypothetical protein
LLVAGVVDFWISTTMIWTKIRRGSRQMHGPFSRSRWIAESRRPFLQILPDLRIWPALSLDLAGSPDLAGPFSRCPWISPKRKKEKNLKKKRADIDLFFSCNYFKKKLQTLATCVRNKWLKIYHFSLFFFFKKKEKENTFNHLKITRG